MNERPPRGPRGLGARASVLFLGVIAGAIFLAGCANTRPGEPRLATSVHGGSGPYLRAIIAEDGRRGSLETAVRRFRPAEGEGPTVYLVGETHFAERSYFEERNRLLDGLDLVLYESVEVGTPGEQTGPERLTPAEKTRRRLELLAVVLRFELEQARRLPASPEELASHPDPAMEARLRERLIRDGWGRPLLYEPEHAADGAPLGFTLRSLGADGLTGGEGEERDLVLTDEQADLDAWASMAAASILQANRVLGLVSSQFVRREHPPHWRRADATFDDVQRRMASAGRAEQFTRILGLSPRLAGFVAEYGHGPFTRELARLDDMNAVSKQFRRDLRAPDADASDGVLLGYRNGIVFAALLEAMKEEPSPRTIGINYGAGHMPDLERRLGEIGYRPDGELWLVAITFDADREGLSEKESRLLRRTARAWSSKWAGRAVVPPRPERDESRATGGAAR